MSPEPASQAVTDVARAIAEKLSDGDWKFTSVDPAGGHATIRVKTPGPTFLRITVEEVTSL